MKIKPWLELSRREVGNYRIFRVLAAERQSPNTGRSHTFFILEADDWVNVIPLTSDNQVIMIRQYRHGRDEITLEVPGGVVDATDPSPAVAAARELAEETGYQAAEIVPLGKVAPNPAFLDNQCHTFLAVDARPNGRQQLDGAEEISFERVPLADIPELIASGQITHSLTITAFYWLERYLAKTETARRGTTGGHTATPEQTKPISRLSRPGTHPETHPETEAGA